MKSCSGSDLKSFSQNFVKNHTTAQIIFTRVISQFMSPTSTRIIVDYDLDANYVPSLIEREIQTSRDTTQRVLVGDDINLRLTPDKYCVGYHLRDEYHEYLPCPQKSKIKRGFQCDICRKMDVLNPCIMCNGASCELKKHPDSKCQTTATSVYVVTFGDKPKVGVSMQDRLKKRWVEQGADWGLEVGVASSGGMARRVEDDISRSLGVAKSIRIVAKLANLEASREDIPEVYMTIRDQIERILEKYPSFKKSSFKPVSLKDSYRLSAMETPMSLDVSGNSHIFGKILGMKGPLLFFLNKVPFVVDFRALRGRAISEDTSAKQKDLLEFEQMT